MGHSDHDQHQAAGKRQISEPVDRRFSVDPGFLELHVGPYRPEQADRHGDQKHQPPADRRQQPAEDKPDEHPCHGDHVIQTEGHSTLIRREGVGQDRGRVRQQERRPNALDDAKRDQPISACRTRQPVDREQQRRGCVDHKAEVVHAHTAVDVAQPSEADHQHTGDDQVAEDHPEQIEAIARHQRVEMDPPEDVGHRDQDDRRIKGGQKHPKRRVAERDPLVALRARVGRVIGVQSFRTRQISKRVSGVRPVGPPPLRRRGKPVHSAGASSFRIIPARRPRRPPTRPRGDRDRRGWWPRRRDPRTARARGRDGRRRRSQRSRL